MVDLIHVHEDDWGMRVLYPAVAEFEILADMKAGAAAAANARDPSGVGWTEIQRIKQPSTTYADVGLRVGDAARVLESAMPRVRRFYATASGGFGDARRDPYGSYDDDAWCFGFGEYCYVKIDVVGERIEQIWFDLSTSDPASVSALRRSFEALDSLVSTVRPTTFNR